LRALAEVGVTEDDWRSIERARRQVDIVNAQLVGRDAGVMYAVTCVPREPVSRITLAEPTDPIGDMLDALLPRRPRAVAPGQVFLPFRCAWRVWEHIEAQDAARRDRELWLQGVKRRLGIIEHGDDHQIRIAQWLADHPGNPGLVPQPLLDAIAGLP
jgi:hypothetical protein